MHFSATTLCVAFLGLIGSTTAIARDHSSPAFHKIQSRQAHVSLAKPALLLQKRTVEITTSFEAAQDQLKVHTDAIKTLCLRLPTANAQTRGSIGHEINSRLGLCSGIVGSCWGGGGIVWPPRPKPSGGGGGGWYPVPGSCWGAATVFSGCIGHVQGCSSYMAPYLHYMPQHSTSIEFGSVQQATDKVLTGFTANVKQMTTKFDHLGQFSPSAPLRLAKLYPSAD